MVELIIKNARVVTEDGVFQGDVAADNGKIIALGKVSSFVEAKNVIDAEGKYLLPGGVDPHVHIRYPGGAHRGTFITETRAAAAGGVTTIIEHPISMPPQYSEAILLSRVKFAEEQAVVDVAFLGAAGGEKIEYIKELGKGGIVGYKTFLHAAPEGRDKEFIGLTMKNNYELYQGFKQVKDTGLPISAHAEDNDIITGLIKEFRKNGNTSGIDHAKSRPPITEVLSVERLIRIAKEMNVVLYLVHISCPESIEAAKRAREEGQKIFIETCPHYLYLTEESLIKHGTYAKCNPPLRSKESVDRMWKYVMDGSVDAIGSDHSPYTIEEKENKKEDVFVAPAGFPGIENRLPLMLTAVKEGKLAIGRAVDLISTNPSKIFGLYPQKGAIKVGADADMVLVDMDKPFIFDHNNLFTKARDISLVYDGKEAYGKVLKTIARGKIVFEDGEIKANPGYGKWVKPIK